jgi:hypothetical protein
MSVEYELPVIMMLGMQGLEADREPSQSDKLSVRMIEPVCQSMGLDYEILFDASDVDVVEKRINSAYEQSKSIAFLIARSPEP